MQVFKGVKGGVQPVAIKVLKKKKVDHTELAAFAEVTKNEWITCQSQHLLLALAYFDS